MRYSNHPARCAQRGMALITALLLLIVVTIMALSMFRSYGVQERIAGNTRDKQRAINAAESAQQYAEYWLTSASAPAAAVCTGPVPDSIGQVCSNQLLSPNTVPWASSVTYTQFTSNSINGVSNTVNAVNATPGSYYQTPQFYIYDLGPQRRYARRGLSNQRRRLRRNSKYGCSRRKHLSDHLRYRQGSEQMMRIKLNVPTAILAGVLAAAFSCGAYAQVSTNDDFTQANDLNSWQTFDGACLTAGDGTGNIPSCIGLPYYGTQIQLGGNSGYLGGATAPSSAATQIPDPPGKGALRFTNWYGQAGSIISSGTPFPSGAGLQVIFKTVTYLGDSGGGGGDGADGIGFFLMDGAYSPYDTGAFGGSLGYTCSNANNDSNTRPVDGTRRGFDGLAHGYLGLGIDEYGNFLNQGDNTASGWGYVPGRIGLRGAGSVAWAQLNALDPVKYPSTLTDVAPSYQRSSAVQNTCQSGFLWDYSNSSAPVQTTTPVLDYPAVPGAYTILNTLLPGQNIANEAAATRSAATPIT